MPAWPSTGPRGLLPTADGAGEERLCVVLNLALAQVEAFLANIPDHGDRQATLRALAWAVLGQLDGRRRWRDWPLEQDLRFVVGATPRRSEDVPEYEERATSLEREALRDRPYGPHVQVGQYVRQGRDCMPALVSTGHSSIEAPHSPQPQLPQRASDAPGAGY